MTWPVQLEHCFVLCRRIRNVIYNRIFRFNNAVEFGEVYAPGAEAKRQQQPLPCGSPGVVVVVYQSSCINMHDGSIHMNTGLLNQAR